MSGLKIQKLMSKAEGVRHGARRWAARAFVATLAVTGTAAVLAAPAVIFDMGGKFDKSFNEAAFRGAEAWKKETGQTYLEFEISNPAQREQAIRRMAERGASRSWAWVFPRAHRWKRWPRPIPSCSLR